MSPVGETNTDSVWVQLREQLAEVVEEALFVQFWSGEGEELNPKETNAKNTLLRENALRKQALFGLTGCELKPRELVLVRDGERDNPGDI